ncbi:MAG: hypothetical protein AABX13_03975 [Nanoarchaeota archaeon]
MKQLSSGGEANGRRADFAYLAAVRQEFERFYQEKKVADLLYLPTARLEEQVEKVARWLRLQPYQAQRGVG